MNDAADPMPPESAALASLGETAMDRARHTRISELFARVCDLPPEEQLEVLQGACADDPSLVTDVLQLLGAEIKPTLRTPALGAGFSLTGSAKVADNGDGPMRDKFSGARRFGPYKVRRCISVGGMAIVYEAEQENPKRIVALKVLRGGVMSRSAQRRFHLETELLGRLQHPGIARIYDAGMHRDPEGPATDPGLPYFAMEFVQGAFITDYATEHGLDMRARMELLAKVCDAVQHAHQHGIIHRDLKPANILVDELGQPRVLDFGIARATNKDLRGTSLHTEAGQLIGTLPYMSPEQVLGDPNEVDTRSDVYALGLLLFELLSGRLPYAVLDTPIPEAARIIREEEPASLATVNRALRGDPATIAARALEKDKARRYQSAAQLGADIRHFLAHEPIMARPASTLYQLGKMARRNRAAVVALAVVVLTLAAAAIVSTWMAYEAQDAKERAVAALAESEGTSGYMLDLFMESPDKPTISRVDLLERAERRLIENPLENPRVEANVHEYIGHGWHKLNYRDNAEPHLQRALEIRRGLGVRDADMAECLMLMAVQRLSQGRIPEGQDALREVLAIRRELFGLDHLAGEHNGELMYWTLLYVPDEPEARQELARRKALREQAPLAPSGSTSAPIVLIDEFDGNVLDPGWSLQFMNCVDWPHSIANSRLTVSDIAPSRGPATPEESTTSWVRLSRPLEQPLGDFRIDSHVGWDSEDQRGALQYLVLYAFGPASILISSVQYGDDWLQFGGARKATIGRYGAAARHVNSGQDTLPDRGEADVAIERVGELVTIYWDGRELMRGLSSDPLATIAISFSWTAHSGPDGKSSFGSEWVDSIRVSGTPSSVGK